MPPSTLSPSLESAHRFYAAGMFDQALEALDRFPTELRDGEEFLLLYGASLARAKRRDEAKSIFAELLAAHPDHFEALTWMAVLSKALATMDDALAYAQRAIDLKPADGAGYGVLGDCYLSARLPHKAIESLLQAIERAPNVVEHRHNLALAYLMAHMPQEGVVQLREALALAPYSPQSYLVLAATHSHSGMVGQAIDCLAEGLSKMPNCAALHSAVGDAFGMIRNDAAAERHHRRAYALSPTHRGSLANWLINQGRFEEANEHFQSMLVEGPEFALAYYGLMQSRKLGDSNHDATFVEAMETLLRSDRTRPRDRMLLHYALGRAEEQRGHYGEAMAHFDAANHLAYGIYHAGHPIDPASFAVEHARVRRLYQSIEQLGPEGDPSEAPFFIIGMIRSGTTLLDQIVSSHPDVSSGGELRFWIEETFRLAAQQTVSNDGRLRELSADYVNYAQILAGPGAHFTDKMPLNFACAGVISKALPNARFLHIRRHPIDTCLSIWTTFFGQGALFAYDKRNVVAYYREYLRAMAYWREALPKDRLLELDYEDIIADPEPNIRQAIEFLGLPWDEACLRHDQNTSAINTPSRWQARQPIYRSSLGRWRRYEPWLGEFAQLLEEA